MGANVQIERLPHHKERSFCRQPFKASQIKTPADVTGARRADSKWDGMGV